MKVRFAFLLVMVGVVATVEGCNRRPLSPLVPCTINGVVQAVPVNPQRELDVLFVIDNSPSMAEEQQKLVEQVPRLVDLLITGAENDPSVEDFPPVEGLHVGIVTTDIGYTTVPPHDFSVPADFNPTEFCSASGDAGFMQTSGGGAEDCSATTPPEGTLYLEFPNPPFTESDLVNDVECLARQGNPANPSCGYEQQLQAILTQDGNSANLGFERQDALLAVILITDEDDCSTTDPRVFDTVDTPGNPFQGPFTSEDQVQFNLRCWAHSEALRDIQDFVTGIQALKGDGSQVVFAAITGVPLKAALAAENFETDVERYDAILADSDMEESPDPDEDDQPGQQLTPACSTPDAGSAAPAIRIVETARGLAEAGVGTVVESICADDYAPALNAIVDRIADALRQLCLPRALNRDADGEVNCEVLEIQPVGIECDESRGRTFLRTEEAIDGTTRDVCSIAQLPTPDQTTPSGVGWFYDDFQADTIQQCSFNPTAQRVNFTAQATPQSGARILFECIEAAPPQSVDIGWPCQNDSDCERTEESLEEQYDRESLNLVCEPTRNTCQLECENDAECPGGFTCFDLDGDGLATCINPTCQLN